MTIFDTPERQKVYRDIIKKLRLIDDAFFNSCFDGDIACMELLLQIIFGNEEAANLAKKAEEFKAAGNKICFCPACQAGETVLENASVLLK